MRSLPPTQIIGAYRGPLLEEYIVVEGTRVSMELVITPWIESSRQHRESSPQGIYTGNTINLLTPSCDHRHDHLPLGMKNYNHDMQKNQEILPQIMIFSAK